MLLAIEIAFEPVSDRFVQHHAWPARAEHNIHLPCRRRNGLKIDQRLADRFIDCPPPPLWLENPMKPFAPGEAITAGLLSLAFARNHRYIQSHHWAYVAVGLPI